MSDENANPTPAKRGARVRVAMVHAPGGGRLTQVRAVTDQPDLVVIGEAETAAEALSVIERLVPDVAVIDLAVDSGSNGAPSLCRAINERFPAVRMVVVVHDEDADDDFQAARNGATAAVPSHQSPDVLPGVIRRVARGEAVLTPAWATRTMAELDHLIADPTVPTSKPEVTPTEREVLKRIAGGATAEEVAVLHDVPVRLVTLHAGAALAKVNRAELERRHFTRGASA